MKKKYKKYEYKGKSMKDKKVKNYIKKSSPLVKEDYCFDEKTGKYRKKYRKYK